MVEWLCSNRPVNIWILIWLRTVCIYMKIECVYLKYINNVIVKDDVTKT